MANGIRRAGRELRGLIGARRRLHDCGAGGTSAIDIAPTSATHWVCMQVMLLQLTSWLAQKLAGALLIALIALAGYGGWLFLQEEGFLEQSRLEKLQQAVADRDRLLAARAAIERQITGLRAEVTAQQARLKQAEKVISLLRDLESWWDRWFGNRTQQSANAEQLERLEALKRASTGRLIDLQESVTKVRWEKEGLESALGRANRAVGLLEESQSRARRYVVLAWVNLRWYLAGALLAFFFGPTVWALSLYYGLAPVMTRGAPIRLGPDPAALPEVGESRVSVEAILQPGDVLRIREKYLQASDEGVGKHTRFVLDWRIPFTSIACGLTELVELRHGRPEGEYRVTLSTSDDPHIEMSITSVPAGGSLVLRPSFLAGVLQRQGERLVIRRHWRIFRWQAWVTGQFRFFEFVGPCRLVIAGSRGVRAERLADREGQAAPARRTNQDATIGFTPNLEYRPVRAETFWSYYRGMNPLFDDLFTGRGLFVVQETTTRGPAAKAGAFWAGVWNGVLKVFGW